MMNTSTASTFQTGESCIVHLVMLRWPYGIMCAWCSSREISPLLGRVRLAGILGKHTEK